MTICIDSQKKNSSHSDSSAQPNELAFITEILEEAAKSRSTRSLLDRLVSALSRTLHIPFVCAWETGATHFLTATHSGSLWRRMSRLPLQWQELEGETRINPSANLNEPAFPNREVKADFIRFKGGRTEIVLVLPQGAGRILSHISPAIREVLKRISLEGRQKKQESLQKRRLANMERRLRDSLEQAQKQVSEKSVLFVVSEIFGSTLPQNVKITSSLEIFRNFLEVDFASAVILGEDSTEVISTQSFSDMCHANRASLLKMREYASQGNAVLQPMAVVIPGEKGDSGDEDIIAFIPFRHGERLLGYIYFPWTDQKQGSDLASQETSGPEPSRVRVPSDFISEETRDFFQTFAGIIGQGVMVAQTIVNLTEMRNFNRNILESMTSGVITFDREGKISLVNDSASRALSRSRDELVGLKLSQLSGLENFSEIIEDTITRGTEYLGHEITISPTRLQTSTHIGVSTSIIRDQSGRTFGVCSIFRDLTRVKELEGKLIHNEKLAALGEMAARVAHEIKNPLTTIRGFLELIHGEVSHEPELREYIEVVFREVDYMVSSLDDLLSFTRETDFTEKYTLQELDLNQCISDILYLEKASRYLRDVNIAKDFDHRISLVNVEKVKIKRVICNILLNSGQAFQTVRPTDPHGAREKRIRISTSFRQGGARIRITDNGPGVPQSVRSRIMTPFFTTKTRGTGLGLAICERIMKKMGGRLRFRSLEGIGTCFEIWVQSVGGPS